MSEPVSYEKIPKLELHVHLDGAFDIPTLFAEAQLHKDRVAPEIAACTTLQEFASLVSVPSSCASLTAFLEVFARFLPLVFDNMALIETLAWKFCEEQQRQNVLYTEVRYCPIILGTDAREVVSRVTASCARASKELNITVHQILCCMNRMPESSMQTVEIANEFRNTEGSRVVGIDIAGGEDHFADESLNSLHLAAASRAQELGIAVTVHAGECDCGDNVSRAIKEYGATRIGHGYRFITDFGAGVLLPPVHFEACISSSWVTAAVPKADLHPSIVMLRQGASIGLNSDDPTVIGTTISEEYRIAASLGCSMDDFYYMANCQVEAAFDKSAAKGVLPALDAYYGSLVTNKRPGIPVA